VPGEGGAITGVLHSAVNFPHNRHQHRYQRADEQLLRSRAVVDMELVREVLYAASEDLIAAFSLF